jgi:hypothetical protein
MAKEKDKKRKPDYDDVPKVLKGPVKAEPSGMPLQARPDYGKGQVGPVQDATMTKDIPLGQGAPPRILPDYDSGIPCPCQQAGGSPLSEEVCVPRDDGGEGLITILVCPDCGTEGPFNLAPPQGVMVEARTLKCAKCQAKIPFRQLVKTASGRYVVAGSDSIEALTDRIRGLIRQGQVITWDMVSDVGATLDRICKLQSRTKKDKD